MPQQVQVPFPDSSMPGTPNHPQESGGRIINAYVEPLGGAAPSQIIYRRAPGLRTFGTTTRTGFRGGIEVDGALYCAFADSFVQFTSVGGAASNVGSGVISGSAKGFFARNTASPEPHKVFVDPAGTQFRWTAAGTITTPIDADTAMPAPNSVCCIDNFFVFTVAAGQVWASDFNSVNINNLAFASVESKPDTLLRAIPWAGNLFLFGAATTEIWQNIGASPFPFQRQLVISRGLAGSYCVAGFEDNFSRALVWVADDNTVVRLNGYTPEKISPPDLDGLIEDVTDKSQLEMSVYMSRGHAFVILSANKLSASSPWREWSWVFDLNNNKWAERASYLRERSRITGGLFAFNKWLCGDIAGGNIQEITNDVHTEANADVTQEPEPFRWQLDSGAVENFPVGARVGRFDCEFVTGVGIVQASRMQNIVNVTAGTFISSPAPGHNLIRVQIANTTLLHSGDAVTIAGVGGTTEANGNWSITIIGPGVIELNGSAFVNAYTGGGTFTDLSPLDPIETDPVVEISWSDDGGQTYYAPIIRKLGRQGQTRELVSLIACTGRSSWNARRWRLLISDPVYVGFMAAYQNISPKVSDIG